MTKRTTALKDRICYRPLKTRNLLATALRTKTGHAAISRLIDECIIGHLGPKYPKLMEEIKAAERLAGTSEA